MALDSAPLCIDNRPDRHDAPFPTPAQGEHPMIMRNLIGVLTMAATLATATAASAHDESKYPDWSGQWRWNAMGGAPRYDPSKPDRKSTRLNSSHDQIS